MGHLKFGFPKFATRGKNPKKKPKKFLKQQRPIKSVFYKRAMLRRYQEIRGKFLRIDSQVLLGQKTPKWPKNINLFHRGAWIAMRTKTARVLQRAGGGALCQLKKRKFLPNSFKIRGGGPTAIFQSLNGKNWETHAKHLHPTNPKGTFVFRVNVIGIGKKKNPKKK